MEVKSHLTTTASRWRSCPTSPTTAFQMEVMEDQVEVMEERHLKDKECERAHAVGEIIEEANSHLVVEVYDSTPWACLGHQS